MNPIVQQHIFASVALVLVAIATQASGQSDGCTASSQQLELSTFACQDTGAVLSASAASIGPVTVETCCPNLVATTDSRRLFGVEDSRALLLGGRSLQSADTCRIVEVSDAYCNSTSTGCSASEANLELEFSFSYETVTSEELCCSTCVCWGDPRCTAFDGSRDNWIICDDRRASNCLHGPVRCKKQKDPWGNKCEYVRNTRVPDSDDDEPWWYDWDQSGSPCQSTPIWEDSKFPSMIMYDGDDQSINLTLGERGIISSMTVTQSTGASYSLTSANCLSDTTSDAWTSTDSSSIPDTWSVVVESDTRVHWTIQNDDATVYTSIMCQATSDYRSRLDITLKVPTAGDASTPANGDGFCSTGSISEDSKGTGTLSIEQDDICLRSELGGCVEACKALVDATCLESNLESNVRYWCEMNDLSGVSPAINTTEECVSRIIDEENCTETSYNWADIVCQVDNLNSAKTSYDESGYQKCLQEIEDFTWFQYVLDRPSYTIVSSDTAPTECISNAAEYNTSKSYDCAVGVQVQSYNSDAESWEDEFFIPADYPPCNDLLNISGADYPNIVTRPIRLVQCESIQAQCATVNSCLPTNGFEVSFNYNMQFCPTPQPTLTPTMLPTESPTQTPTETPTSAPTETPTSAPTEAPTSAPTEAPTSAPTEAPTSAPTEAPTSAPTEAPTSAPTEAPTSAPTEAPTSAPTEAPTPAPAGPVLAPSAAPEPSGEGTGAPSTSNADSTGTESPSTTIESSCYDCLVSQGTAPQICSTDNVYMELGECETCCQDESSSLPELTEYGYCRSQETTRPYCNMSSSSESALCSSLADNEGTLDINITYASAEEMPNSCCSDCSVYGDPEMISFQTTTFNITAWIICDGRTKTDDDTTCPIEEDTCTSEVDQDGNACYYNQTRADLISGSSQANIGAIGSPCQANPDSNPAVMEVYTTPSGDFAINTILGERAVINAAIFTVNGTNYTLTASQCFGDAGSGWDQNITGVLNNVTYDSDDQNPTARGATRNWSFMFEESIYVQITCLKMIAQGGDAEGITGYRLDLDHIIDTDETRSGSELATGFCPTDKIDYMQSNHTKTGSDSVFYTCTWQQWSMALTLAKALVSAATISSDAEISAAIESWCTTANVFNTASDPATACYDKIWNNGNSMTNIGKRWTTQYCTAISSNRGTWSLNRWLSQCTSDIYQETFGITTYVEMYGTGERDTDNTCSSDPSYNTTSSVCEQGIFVEYYDEDLGEWVEEFFVPALQLPCDGIISLSYSDYPNLFQNKIRFRQCDQQANNGCSLAYSCMSAQGFSVSYQYSYSGEICSSSS